MRLSLNLPSSSNFFAGVIRIRSVSSGEKKDKKKERLRFSDFSEMESDNFVSSQGLEDADSAASAAAASGGNFTCLNVTAELSGKKGILMEGGCSARHLSG